MGGLRKVCLVKGLGSEGGSSLGRVLQCTAFWTASKWYKNVVLILIRESILKSSCNISK